MEELRSAMEGHMELMSDLVQKLSSEIRSGIRPAYDNFIGFFHAIDWKEPWLMSLLAFHVVLLITTIFSRKNTNFQMCLFLLTLLGVYFAESLNRLLGDNWKKFATQNYFEPMLPNSSLEKGRTQTPCKAFPQQAGLKWAGGALLPSPSSIACAFINCIRKIGTEKEDEKLEIGDKKKMAESRFEESGD
ncbi:putative Malectin/receptor protein kinase family protein [Hibiscus syriacus]|uniref:Transmembrane protein 18 n=1 Tax=Hibiscus syriacus TaxID=106335 RepID=A0A6A3BEB6_HIBSY|nr:putative Malectin/receptor protein kinase family protein [Hibiscus syriacus]